MRLLIYSLILLLLLYAPIKRLDVAKLEPVEVICIDVREGETILLTDTEAWGKGENVIAAMEDMRSRAAGVIYLDTAKFLLATEAAVANIEDLRPYLKGSVKLCRTEETDTTDLAEFLEIHSTLPKLKQWQVEGHLPILKDGKIIE